MRKEKRSLTEHTESTEKRWKAKNVVGFFCSQKNPTTILLCDSQSTHGNRREPSRCGRKIFEFCKKLLANSLPSSLSLSMLSVNSSELGERVRDIRRSSGFTLVELLVVIVLMAIIIAMSAPAFVGMGRGAGMRGAVRSVHSTLSLLRQWAITHREPITFYYFVGGVSSSSYYYAANEIGTIIDKTNELPLEVIFGPDDGVGESFKVTFKTDGSLAVVGSSTKKIYIRDRKFPDDTGKQKTISINGLTGGIHVE